VSCEKLTQISYGGRNDREKKENSRYFGEELGFGKESLRCRGSVLILKMGLKQTTSVRSGIENRQGGEASEVLWDKIAMPSETYFQEGQDAARPKGVS